MYTLPKGREVRNVALALTPEMWALLSRLSYAEKVDIDHVVSELVNGALADLAHNAALWEPQYVLIGDMEE